MSDEKDKPSKVDVSAEFDDVRRRVRPYLIAGLAIFGLTLVVALATSSQAVLLGGGIVVIVVFLPILLMNRCPNCDRYVRGAPPNCPSCGARLRRE
jgi:hypothetical protein